MPAADPASSDIVRLLLVVVAAAVAGALNAIAGGGTLITFPALVALGVPPVAANATSTVALWPGSVGSVWGYRSELAGGRRWAGAWTAISLAGGLAGAVLLLRTPPERFAAIAPWLVLVATLLFAAGRRVALWRHRRSGAPAAGFPPLGPGGAVAQLAVAVYGGYFGAGIGILMLATLGFLGFTDINRMNGLKNWGGLCINAVAALTFAVSGIVDWPAALLMAVASALGGFGGARLARRLPQPVVRGVVIAVGLASAAWLLVAGS